MKNLGTEGTEDFIRKSLNQKVKNYFYSPNFQENLPLTSNGVLSFHWSNCAASCELQRENLQSLGKTQEELQRLEDQLEDLKNWKIWLKCKTNSIECSLYDLYESYLDPRMRINWFQRQDEILVSLHNEAGPFVALSSMRWIDKEIYRIFVYRKILTGNMTMRDFRLSLDVPMTVYFDDRIFEKTTMTICQASRNGVLIRFQGHRDLNKVLGSNQMSFLFNSRAFTKTPNKDVSQIITSFSEENFTPSENEHSVELKLNKDILRLYGNYDNIKSSDGKSYFLFVRYSDFICQDPKKDFPGSMKSMVETFESFFKDQIVEIHQGPQESRKESVAA